LRENPWRTVDFGRNERYAIEKESKNSGFRLGGITMITQTERRNGSDRRGNSQRRGRNDRRGSDRNHRLPRRVRGERREWSTVSDRRASE
jgi:hypothetical protein